MSQNLQAARLTSQEVSRYNWSREYPGGIVTWDTGTITVGALQRIADAVEALVRRPAAIPASPREIAEAVRAGGERRPGPTGRDVAREREQASRLRSQAAYLKAGGVIAPEDMEPGDGGLPPDRPVCELPGVASARLRKAMRRLGVETFRGLAEKTEAALSEARNVGATTVLEARGLLARAGLRFADAKDTD